MKKDVIVKVDLLALVVIMLLACCNPKDNINKDDAEENVPYPTTSSTAVTEETENVTEGTVPGLDNNEGDLDIGG